MSELKTFESEKIQDLVLEFDEKGNGCAKLNGEEFVKFDLSDGSSNFETKGWECWGTKTVEAAMNFAEVYAETNLQAKEIQNPLQWIEDSEPVNLNYKDNTEFYKNSSVPSTFKHFTIEVGENAENGKSIFVNASGFLKEDGNVAVEFDDKTENALQGFILDGEERIFCEIPEEAEGVIEDAAKEIITQEIVYDILGEEARNLSAYKINLYSGYNDKISEEDMAVWVDSYLTQMLHDGTCEHQDFRDFLYQEVCKSQNVIWRENEDLKGILEANTGFAATQLVLNYVEDHGEHLSSFLADHGVFVTYEIDDLIDEYQMNLMIITPNDANYGNSVLTDLAGEDIHSLNRILSEHNPEEHFDTAFTYMVYQQGYKMTEVLRQVYDIKQSNDKFVQEAAEALRTAPSYFAELTAAVRLDKDNLDIITQIGKEEGYIALPAGTEMCIFDRINRHESEPFELKKEFIFSAEEATYIDKTHKPETNVVQIYHPHRNSDVYADSIYEATRCLDELTAPYKAEGYDHKQAETVAEILHDDIPNIVKAVQKDAKAIEILEHQKQEDREDL